MPDRSMFRLGKRPATRDHRTLRLSEYVDLSALPPIPDTFDWGAKVGNFGMHKNDVYGDCVIAAAANQIEADSANSATEIDISDADVVAAYSAVTGFNPNDPSTDQGTDPLEFMKYWRTTGLAGHKIGAFVNVDTHNETLIHAAAYLFGGFQIGLDLPVSAQRQSVWDVVSHDGGEWGGHMVYIRARDGASRYVCETWNEQIPITLAFIQRYCPNEIFAVIPQEWLNNQGLAPNGIDIAALTADLAIVGGQQPPTPPSWQPDPLIQAFLDENAADWAWSANAYRAAQSPTDAGRVTGYASTVIAADDSWKPYLGGKGKKPGKLLPGVPQ